MNSLLKRTQDSTNYGLLYTPYYATELIVPYLHGTIWECASGQGHMTAVFEKHGLKVVETDIETGTDFLTCDPPECDMIVTNPPYKQKDRFLERCYELDIPFALLLPLTALGGARRVGLFSEHGLEVLIPDKRVNFIYGKGDKKASWFHSAWFCKGVLPEKLMFAEMERHDN